MVNISIPVLVSISRIMGLMDLLDERRVHTSAISNIDGIAIFIGFTLSVIVTLYDIAFNEFRILLGSLIIMFFIGLKDDLIVISPQKELSAQIVTDVMLIVLGNFRFTNLHGLFGVFELNATMGLFSVCTQKILITNNQ